jgi:hypothetical protein
MLCCLANTLMLFNPSKLCEARGQPPDRLHIEAVPAATPDLIPVGLEPFGVNDFNANGAFGGRRRC